MLSPPCINNYIINSLRHIMGIIKKHVINPFNNAMGWKTTSQTLFWVVLAWILLGWPSCKMLQSQLWLHQNKAAQGSASRDRSWYRSQQAFEEGHLFKMALWAPKIKSYLHYWSSMTPKLCIYKMISPHIEPCFHEITCDAAPWIQPSNLFDS